MQLSAPSSISKSELVFGTNPSRLAQQAEILARNIANPWLFQDGLTLEGTIENRNEEIPAKIKVHLRDRIDHKRPYWENVKRVTVTPETNHPLGLVFIPKEKGFGVFVYGENLKRQPSFHDVSVNWPLPPFRLPESDVPRYVTDFSFSQRESIEAVREYVI